jgi:hypothetical protein
VLVIDVSLDFHVYPIGMTMEIAALTVMVEESVSSIEVKGLAQDIYHVPTSIPP